MPGAITNPQLNPLQSFLDYTHQTEDVYNQSVGKGYRWDGTKWVYTGTEVAPGANGPAGHNDTESGYNNAVQSPGKTPLTISGASSGLSTGSSSTGTGGYKIDAQLGAIDQKFAEDVKQATEMEREGLAGRGMLTGMVGQASERRARAPLEAERMAAQERLGNQQQTYQNQLDFAKQQAEWQRQLAMMSGGTYSSKDDSGLSDILAGLLGGGTTGGIQNPVSPGDPSKNGTSVMQTGTTLSADPKTGEPIRGKGEDYDSYMARWNAWFNGKKKTTPGSSGATNGTTSSAYSDATNPYVPGSPAYYGG